MPTDDALELLRRERDRFAAFSGAAADLLLEVEPEGRIAYAAGAGQLLAGQEPASLVGRSLYDLLAADDRQVCATLTRSIGQGGRLAPVAVRLAGAGAPPAMLGGCVAPDGGGRVFVTLAIAGLPPQQGGSDRGLLSRGAFIDMATLRSAVGSTVDGGSFALAFQPVVDLGSGAVHHLEALARFTEDASPGSIVALAEATGLIAGLDLAVCSRVVSLLAAGAAGQAPVAVNLSGRSLGSQLFRAELLQLVEPGRSLERKLLFEITETAGIADMAAVDELVQTLRRRGFRICLDDFGAGASSLHYLRAFAVDFIKIDGQFGRNAMHEPRERSLLRCIVDFCRENQVQVIAEMIETEAQAALFRELGVLFGQGYLYGEPHLDPARYGVGAPAGRERRQ
jgi:EAL domain-containing protein (putative c-di-GMP-specific phosphodiesterase class I)